MAIAIKMPKLSPTMETGVLSSWLVEVGTQIKEGDIIAEIETDKAIMEVEALESGTIGYIADVVGKETPVNNVIGYILAAGEKAPDSWQDLIAQANGVGSDGAAKIEDVVKEETIQEVEQPEIEVTGSQIMASPIMPSPIIASRAISSRIIASPLARKIAEQKGLSLEGVVGSGPNGRIIKADVENIEKVSRSVSTASSALRQLVGRSHELPITNMRKIIAQRLTQAKQEIPHIYLQRKVIMDALEIAKTKLIEKFSTSFDRQNSPDGSFETKITITPLLIKATAMALNDNPVLNRSYEKNADGTAKVMQHEECNINVAIAIENGLVTPVIKNANLKGIRAISQELNELAVAAKAGKLKVEQLQGGTFSVSNLGMFGIEAFDAIINQPQVGIIALASTFTSAHFDGENFVPQRVMNCTLSCDHRVVDGTDGAKFLASLANYIEHPEGMLL